MVWSQSETAAPTVGGAPPPPEAHHLHPTKRGAALLTGIALLLAYPLVALVACAASATWQLYHAANSGLLALVAMPASLVVAGGAGLALYRRRRRAGATVAGAAVLAELVGLVLLGALFALAVSSTTS